VDEGLDLGDWVLPRSNDGSDNLATKAGLSWRIVEGLKTWPARVWKQQYAASPPSKTLNISQRSTPVLRMLRYPGTTPPESM